MHAYNKINKERKRHTKKGKSEDERNKTKKERT
jgi:hypothetical protein